jgi:cyclopropane fatty-acyl-phospholipid synthase-like methyltransferase
MTSTPYDQIAAEFAHARRQFRPNEKRYLDLLTEHLRPGDAVLDLGCGNGHPIAEFLAERRFAVTGVDGSAAMLARAEANLPAHRWIHSLIEDAELPETFDAVVCWDSLFHVHRSKWAAVLGKVHRWLKPGGRFLLSSGGVVDRSGGFTDSMFGHEFFYDSLPPDELLDTLRGVGFDVVLAEMCDQPDGGRGRGKWATIAEKNLSENPQRSR